LPDVKIEFFHYLVVMRDFMPERVHKFLWIIFYIFIFVTVYCIHMNQGLCYQVVNETYSSCCLPLHSI
jgi:hypothetical protein